MVTQTQQLHLLTFGQALVAETDVEQVLDLLRQGQGDLICIVQWEPDIYHSVVLKFWQRGRIYFYNPQRPVMSPAGSVVVDEGPLRRAEEEGLESLTEEELRQWFASACCLVPG